MILAKRWFAVVVLGSLLACVAVAKDDKETKNEEKPDNKALQLKACGEKDKEVDYKAETDKNSHPTPEPSNGKAMIYVMRPTMAGNKVQTKLAVDGVWKGVNRGNNYFFFEVEPGDHYFCSVSENHDVMPLKVEAGKTYFLQQHISMGFMKARNNLEIMEEAKAKEKLSKLHLATWEEKK